MAFVNEFVSEEDIEKYSLNKILNKYRKYSSQKLPQPSYKYFWAIDRENDSFLMQAWSVHECGLSGRPEPTGVIIYIFRVLGKEFEFKIRRASGSSNNINQSPYKIIWDFVEVSPADFFNFSSEEVIEPLKKALAVYGYRSAMRSVENTIVSFNF